MNLWSMKQQMGGRKLEASHKRQQNTFLLATVVFCLWLSAATPAVAVVTVTGDVDPTPPVAGGTISVSTFLVGDTGLGTLSITDGMRLENNNNNARNAFGDDASGVGLVTVDGFQSELVFADPLLIGNAGFGQLQVLNQARVTNEDGIIADDAGSTGIVSVVGLGTIWETNEDLLHWQRRYWRT